MKIQKQVALLAFAVLCCSSRVFAEYGKVSADEKVLYPGGIASGEGYPTETYGPSADPHSKKKPPGEDVTYQGCYSFPNDFIRKSLRRHDKENANIKCAVGCKNEGYILALTQDQLCVCTNDFPYIDYISTNSGKGTPCDVTCPGVRADPHYTCLKDECCGGYIKKKKSIFSVYSTGSIDIYLQLKRRVFRALTVDGYLEKLFPYSYKNARCYNEKSKGYGYSLLDKIQINVHDIELHLVVLRRVLKKNIHPYNEAIPLGTYDAKLDNTDSPTENELAYVYEFEDIYVDSYETSSGYEKEVAVSTSITPEDAVRVLGLPSKAESEFGQDVAEGVAWETGYHHEVSTGITQAFEVAASVPPFSFAEIRAFLEKDIYEIKWRASFFSSGFVSINWCNSHTQVHVSQILDQRARQFFAFGTAKYHERYTWVGKVLFFDKYGSQIVKHEEEDEAKLKEGIERRREVGQAFLFRDRD